MRDSDRYDRADRYEDRDRACGPPLQDDDRHYRPRDRYDDMPARDRDRRRFDSASYYDDGRSMRSVVASDRSARSGAGSDKGEGSNKNHFLSKLKPKWAKGSGR